MASLSLEDVRTLLDAPSAAVLTTTRTDGSALTSPVWFRWTGHAFEIVIAHLAADAGERFAAERASKPGVLLQLVPDQPRIWDLADILPR